MNWIKDFKILQKEWKVAGMMQTSLLSVNPDFKKLPSASGSFSILEIEAIS